MIWIRGAIVGVVVLAATLLARPGSARAQSQTRPLSEAVLVRGNRCLDAGSLHPSIGAWLGRFEIDRRVEVEVEEALDDVRIQVRRDRAVVGERRMDLRGRPCDEVRAAVALGVASALDATILDSLGVARPPPMAAVSTEAGPPAALPQVAIEDAKQHPKRSVAVRMMVEETVLLNVLPRVVLGAAPAVEISPLRGMDLRVAALAAGGRSVTVGSGSASVTLLVGQLDLCGGATVAAAGAHLRGCGGFAAGAALGEGRGFASSRTSAVPWLAFTVRADVRWSLTPAVGIVLSAEGLFPFLRPELQDLDTRGKVIASEPFPVAGVAIGLGPVVDF